VADLDALAGELVTALGNTSVSRCNPSCSGCWPMASR